MSAVSARPPLDADIASALRAREDIVVQLLPHEVETLRERPGARTDEDATADGRLVVERRTVATTTVDVPMYVLRVRGSADPAPVLYHVHGGGLVVGAARDDLPMLARFVARYGWVVVAVDYRLAPENPYPAALDDVYAGLGWLQQHADSVHGDAARIVLSGVSAGGGLAAAAALRARDEGGPRILGQMLVCPMLDDRNDSFSAHQMAGVGAWDRTANETGWSAYLGADRRDVSPYASPARATDLSRLPPMFLDVGSAETFRDEVVAYAMRVWACGGDAELHVWPGGVHGFDMLAPHAPLSRAARHAREDWLMRLVRRAAS